MSKKFFKACQKGKVSRVAELAFDEDFDTDWLTETHQTGVIGFGVSYTGLKFPLYVAVEGGHYEVVEFLLANFGDEININQKVYTWGGKIGRLDRDETCLHCATKKGNVGIAKLLLDAKGINIKTRDKKKRTAYEVSKTVEIRSFITDFEDKKKREKRKEKKRRRRMRKKWKKKREKKKAEIEEEGEEESEPEEKKSETSEEEVEVSEHQQEKSEENDEEVVEEEISSPLYTFLEGIGMKQYFEPLESDGVKYEDLFLFLETPSLLEEYLPNKKFLQTKFLNALKEKKQPQQDNNNINNQEESDLIYGEYNWNGKSLLIKKNSAFFENERHKFEKLTSNVYKLWIRGIIYVFIWDEEDEMLRVVRTKGPYEFIKRKSVPANCIDPISGEYDWNGKSLDIRKNHCYFDRKRYEFEKVASCVYTVKVKWKRFVFQLGSRG